MNLKIYKNHKAEKDLIGIWLCSCEKRGASQADKYLDKLNNALKVIASNPEARVNIDFIRKGYFKYQFKEHIIFYSFNKATINIMRVLGNDMNYIQHL